VPRRARPARSWRVRYGDWIDEAGLVDDVTVTTYAAPNSYTGQDMFEVVCHGNPVLIEAVLASLLRAGARSARPGEFTLRAVLAGKMDLLEAEAVHGVIEANTRFQADLMRRQAHGPLVATIRDQVEVVLAIQAHIEATIDYGEEDIDALDRARLAAQIDGLYETFCRLRETGRFAEGMRRGFKVLLTGAPNVGKSTLFNCLVKQERAIVTELPGTTRDLIHEEVELEGLPVSLIDSAGVRETDDRVETLGIDRIFALLHDVDLVLFLREAGSEQPLYPRLETLPEDKILVVETKGDLKQGLNDQNLVISAETGMGLDRLVHEVVLRLSSAMAGQDAYVISQRQQALIETVCERLSEARASFAQGYGEEILTRYLTELRNDLGELTGETTHEDVLDRMFATFCLGK